MRRCSVSSTDRDSGAGARALDYDARRAAPSSEAVSTVTSEEIEHSVASGSAQSSPELVHARSSLQHPTATPSMSLRRSAQNTAAEGRLQPELQLVPSPAAQLERMSHVILPGSTGGKLAEAEPPSPRARSALERMRSDSPGFAAMVAPLCTRDRRQGPSQCRCGRGSRAGATVGAEDAADWRSSYHRRHWLQRDSE